jgi:type IV secretion system protein VirB8
MFRRKDGDKADSGKMVAAAQKGVNYEVSIADLARRSERRAWIVACTSMAVTVMTAGGYYYMLPLKEKVPYLVMADAYSGNSTVAKLEPNFGGQTIGASEALARSNVARFVMARESYDFAMMGLRDWNTVFAMASTPVATEYRVLHAPNNASAPYYIYGKIRAVRVNILSITLQGGNGKPYTGANVRFQRTIYDKNAGSSTLLDNKIATMAFAYKSNLSMPESLRVENPLGFQVADYRVDNDYSSTPVPPASAQTVTQLPDASTGQPGVAPAPPADGALMPAVSPLPGAESPGGAGQAAPVQQGAPVYPDQVQQVPQPTGSVGAQNSNANGANGR